MFRYVVGAVVVGLLLFGWLVVWPYIQQVPCPACKGKGFVMAGIIEIPCPYFKTAGTVAPYVRDIILVNLEKKRRAEEEKRKAEEEQWKKESESGNIAAYGQ